MPNTGDSISVTLQALAHAGCEDVFLFDLASPSPLAHVVRILTPGLGAYMEGDVASVSVNDLIPRQTTVGGPAGAARETRP